jgi:hypothetical protein
VEFLKQAIWIRNLIREINLSTLQPIIVEQDNKSAILMMVDVSKYRRSKHMLIKIAFARDLVKTGKIEIQYVPSNQLTADLLTKPKQGASFTIHRAKLLSGTEHEN